jgi:hypothetical protein
MMNCDFTGKWDEISSRGHNAGRFRVCPDHLLDIFVSFSVVGEREFVLEFPSMQLDMDLIPKFENIDVEFRDLDGIHSLVLRLKDNDLSDLFSNICSDLAEGASGGVTPESAVHMFVARLNRWADLLRRGRSNELSFIERLGLLGELCVLIWAVTECNVDPSLVVRGWRGPEADTNDIGINNVRVEVKAQLSTQRKSVKISSLDQLDSAGGDLFLAVVRLCPSDEGVSLESVILTISTWFELGNKWRSEFQRKLYVAGYDSNADYIKEVFSLEELRTYRVMQDFPSLVPSNVPAGVVKVSYEIDCEAIKVFEISPSDLGVFIDA